MSIKLGDERTQRGASPAVSIRLPEDQYDQLLDLEDHTHKTKSEIARTFIQVGLNQLATENPEYMSAEVELIWREFKEAKAADTVGGKRMPRKIKAKNVKAKVKQRQQAGKAVAVLTSQLAEIAEQLEQLGAKTKYEGEGEGH